MIKKSNFVKIDKTIIRSSHPPLDSILVTTKKDEVTKEEVKSSPFKIADEKLPLLVLLNKTILLINHCILLVNNLTVLKKKLLKNYF